MRAKVRNCTGSPLIQKMDGAGYALRINEAGGVTLAAKSGGASTSLASLGAVNNGQWHHVIAEADRKAGTFTIYLDGKQDASGPGLGAGASLANDADLFVGGTPQGQNLDGAIEFMGHRIDRMKAEKIAKMGIVQVI